MLAKFGVGFSGDLVGYHCSDDVLKIRERAAGLNLFVNTISPTEIVVSRSPVWLGKNRFVNLGDNYLRSYFSLDEWNNLKRIYQHIKHIEVVPDMSFPKEKIVLIKKFEGEELLTAKVSELHKVKFLNFLKEMNSLGFVHRDLHCKNIIISTDSLCVVDWDFVTEQKCDILNSYDLTGQGLPSPHLTDRCHIFKSFPLLGPAISIDSAPSVAELLNITRDDFNV